MNWGELIVRLLTFAVFLAAMVLVLTACASAPQTPPEPIIITKEVDRIVQVRCMDARPPAPDLPDDDESIAEAPDLFSLAKIYRAARALYRQRIQEDDAQIKACVGE